MNHESTIRPGGYLDQVIRRCGALEGDWDHVMDRALDYGVDSYLAFWSGAQWQIARRVLMAQCVWRRQKLWDVLDLVGHLDVLVLKGEPLSVRLFEVPYVRRSGDLDLLVRLSDVDQWAAALTTLGYRPMYADRPEPWLYDQWAFVHPEHAFVVELHWAIAPPPMPSPQFDVLWRSSQDVVLGDRVVRTLSDGHMLVHLCYHFHHHMGFLKGLWDLAAWCDRYEFDRQAIADAVTLARALGVEPMVRWPMRLLELCCGRSPVAELEDTWWSMAMAAWSDRVLQGALSHEGEIGGGSSLAFKTHDALQHQVVFWQMLGCGAVGSVCGQLKVFAFPVWRSPEVLARGRGANDAQLRDWLGMVLRPMEMVYKAIFVRR